jgi:hypothetical protein
MKNYILDIYSSSKTARKKKTRKRYVAADLRPPLIKSNEGKTQLKTKLIKIASRRNFNAMSLKPIRQTSENKTNKRC